MTFAGPRGNVRIWWKWCGHSYAEILIEEPRQTWLGTKWERVWDGPRESSLRADYVRSLHPDDLIKLYVKELEQWVRFDRAWQKFHEGQALEKDGPTFKLLPTRS